MATPQEVEIKFQVSDLKALEKKLKQLGFKCETPSTHEVNTLYDLRGQTIEDSAVQRVISQLSLRVSGFGPRPTVWTYGSAAGLGA